MSSPPRLHDLVGPSRADVLAHEVEAAHAPTRDPPGSSTFDAEGQAHETRRDGKGDSATERGLGPGSR